METEEDPLGEEAPRPLLEALMDTTEEQPRDTKEEEEPFSLTTNNLQAIKEETVAAAANERLLQSAASAATASLNECSSDEVSQSPFKAPTAAAASAASGTAEMKTATEQQVQTSPKAQPDGGVSPAKILKSEPKEEEREEGDVGEDRKSSASSSPHKKSSHRHRPRRANVRIQCRIDRHQKTSSAAAASSRRGYCMANACPTLASHPKYKYGHLMSVEVHPNGGAKVLHMWQEDLEGMSEEELEELAKEFLEVGLPNDLSA